MHVRLDEHVRGSNAQPSEVEPKRVLNAPRGSWLQNILSL